MSTGRKLRFRILLVEFIRWRAGFWVMLATAMGIAHGLAQRSLPVDNPTVFFTTVAARLLKAELGSDLSRLQLYPTNEYTAAVHRLLQLSANIYDSTTNRTLTAYPYVPSVFRPLFTNDGGAIYIRGYVEETGTNLLSAPMRDLGSAADRDILRSTDMVKGVPVIIGAKKGYPNFSNFGMDTVVEVSRQLEFRRNPPDRPITETNQMYVLSISNALGIAFWNSYTNAFSRDLALRAEVAVTTVMTNESGGAESVVLSNRVVCGAGEGFVVPANSWQGMAGRQPVTNAFRIPFLTNLVALPESVYSLAFRRFEPVGGEFERLGNLFPVPQWWLSRRIELVVATIDVEAGRIVDYVNVDWVPETLDVTDMLMRNTPGALIDCRIVENSSTMPPGSLWCTNRMGASSESLLIPTQGLINQQRVGMGSVFAVGFPLVATNKAAIDAFRFQFGLSPLYGSQPPSLSNVFYCPFNCRRDIYLTARLDANDPLVHYTKADLTWSNYSDRDFSSLYATVPNLGRMNYRYEPWSGYWLAGSGSPSRYNPLLKDPGVDGSDAWDFPENQALGLGWLGRVHRGTPWQTVYWKSDVIDRASWVQWLGGENAAAAMQTHPTNDWRLVDILGPLFSDGYGRGGASVNQPSADSYAALLEGITVVTNSGGAVLEPMVVSSNSTQALLIGEGLETNRFGPWNGAYRSVGDILSTRQLSFGSPFLNLSKTNAITDRAYEAIPAQLLTRLRPDSVGWVDAGGGRLGFTGLEGASYAVEASSDLVSWLVVSTNTVTGGVFYYTPPEGSEREFYRSVLVE